MKQNWSESELIESWDLTDSERNLLDQRTEHGLFGFAILLKFFQLEGRFPLNHKEVPSVVVQFMAGICCLPVSAWNEFSFKGRSGERTRAQIRDFLGFRPATLADGAQIQAWLCQEVIPHDQEPRHLRAGVFDWCREHRIEPPTHDRIDRLIGAAVHTFENEFFQGIKSKLPTETLSHPGVSLYLLRINARSWRFGSENNRRVTKRSLTITDLVSVLLFSLYFAIPRNVW